ncbi:hypothetical protein VTK56DRAFT_4277 [Thermocarpiscus australiensis]
MPKNRRMACMGWRSGVSPKPERRQQGEKSRGPAFSSFPRGVASGLKNQKEPIILPTLPVAQGQAGQSRGSPSHDCHKLSRGRQWAMFAVRPTRVAPSTVRFPEGFLASWWGFTFPPVRLVLWCPAGKGVNKSGPSKVLLQREEKKTERPKPRHIS